jgi:hypothetical protein
MPTTNLTRFVRFVCVHRDAAEAANHGVPSSDANQSSHLLLQSEK